MTLACVVFCGCDTARVDRLEKENAELKAKVDKADVARDYDLQAKCSKDARAWFNKNWSLSIEEHSPQVKSRQINLEE